MTHHQLQQLSTLGQCCFIYTLTYIHMCIFQIKSQALCHFISLCIFQYRITNDEDFKVYDNGFKL